jgi:hypothetical protein
LLGYSAEKYFVSISNSSRKSDWLKIKDVKGGIGEDIIILDIETSSRYVKLSFESVRNKLRMRALEVNLLLKFSL